MNTDGFIWMMRERDDLRESVRRLKRELAEQEKKLAEVSALIERETAPKATVPILGVLNVDNPADPRNREWS